MADVLEQATACYKKLPLVYDGWDEDEVIKEIAKAIVSAKAEERLRIAQSIESIPENIMPANRWRLRLSHFIRLGAPDMHGMKYDRETWPLSLPDERRKPYESVLYPDIQQQLGDLPNNGVFVGQRAPQKTERSVVDMTVDEYKTFVAVGRNA